MCVRLSSNDNTSVITELLTKVKTVLSIVLSAHIPTYIYVWYIYMYWYTYFDSVLMAWVVPMSNFIHFPTHKTKLYCVKYKRLQ